MLPTIILTLGGSIIGGLLALRWATYSSLKTWIWIHLRDLTITHRESEADFKKRWEGGESIDTILIQTLFENVERERSNLDKWIAPLTPKKREDLTNYLLQHRLFRFIHLSFERAFNCPSGVSLEEEYFERKGDPICKS